MNIADVFDAITDGVFKTSGHGPTDMIPTREQPRQVYLFFSKKFSLDGALLVQPSLLGLNNRYLLQVLEDYASNRAVTLKGVARA
ncbi:hypothetical protein [Phaeobacter sp. C3_T13_0]|uniref:hypothetical protein n=1 Tax=Phaeobacter cretensis TaxID=3342641 RepID=UPI0039BD839C